MSKAEVGCAGILVEDTFCGPMPDLPHEGQLVAIDAMPVKTGGCAAKVAIDLAKQGIAVEAIGCVGRDACAATLSRSLEEAGVGCGRLVQADTLPTSRTVILLVKGQDRRYVHMFGANRALTIAHIPRDWVAGLKVFYLGGLGAMPGIKMDELSDLLAFCRARGVTTVVDVVIPRQFAALDELRSLLLHIDYFLPNDEEARILTVASDPLVQLRVLRGYGARNLIITLGKLGATASQGDNFWRCNAYPAQVLDPSGAGDAFASGVIVGILRRWDLPKTLRYASALGVSATRAVGTTDGVFNATEAATFVNAQALEITQGKL